jgi:hypothetical protein
MKRKNTTHALVHSSDRVRFLLSLEFLLRQLRVRYKVSVHFDLHLPTSPSSPPSIQRKKMTHNWHPGVPSGVPFKFFPVCGLYHPFPAGLVEVRFGRRGLFGCRRRGGGVGGRSRGCVNRV